MTNGEMIQKVFNCEVCEPIIEDDIIHVIFADKKDSAIGFDWSWWNAEYKEPTTKNDLAVDKLLAGCEKMSFEIEIFNKPLRVVALDAVKNIVKGLPSVTPQEPKIGHWIPTYGNVKCSVCGSVKDSREVGKATHYCDFCGAKMIGEI